MVVVVVVVVVSGRSLPGPSTAFCLLIVWLTSSLRYYYRLGGSFALLFLKRGRRLARVPTADTRGTLVLMFVSPKLGATRRQLKRGAAPAYTTAALLPHPAVGRFISPVVFCCHRGGGGRRSLLTRNEV